MSETQTSDQQPAASNYIQAKLVQNPSLRMKTQSHMEATCGNHGAIRKSLHHNYRHIDTSKDSQMSSEKKTFFCDTKYMPMPILRSFIKATPWHNEYISYPISTWSCYLNQEVILLSEFGPDNLNKWSCESFHMYDSVSSWFQTGTDSISNDVVYNHADHKGERHWFHQATWEMTWLQLCNHYFLQVPTKKNEVKVFAQHHSFGLSGGNYAKPRAWAEFILKCLQS